MSAQLQPQPLHMTDVEQIDRVNATRPYPHPVHSRPVATALQLGTVGVPSSSTRATHRCALAGRATVTLSWRPTQRPGVLANRTVGQVADHYAAIIGKLDRKLVVIGTPSVVCSSRSSPAKAWRRRRWRSTPHRSGEFCLTRRCEAEDLFETFAVPASGAPIFQAAAANRNPQPEAKVNSVNADRGPMLIISEERPHRSHGYQRRDLRQAETQSGCD
jgi:non-heme chloroperoxidase